MQKYIKISNDKIFELKKRFSFDPFKGIFTFNILINKNGKDKKNSKKIAGSIHKSTGYISIRYKYRSYLAHRLAWLFYYGEMPESMIDHIDGNKINNAISNLRLANNIQNQQNIKKSHNDSRTGYLGVTKDKRNRKKSYRAVITINKKTIRLGTFSTAELAHAAYLKAKKELHPFFVKLN